MKCSRCGEEYKENQVFCIKCGSPIHVVPDFDLIEAELASSVGELMSDNSEITEKEESTGNKTQNYIPNTRREKELDIININKKNDIDQIDKQKESDKKSKNKNNLIVGMIIAAALILILVIAVLAKIIFGGEKAGNFESRYETGMEFFASEDYQAALDELLIADKLAESDEEIILVKEALLSVYQMMDGKTDEQILVLTDLIGLVPEETSYYEKLATIYNDEDMNEELQNLINTAPESVYNEIKSYGVSAPEIKPESGDIDEVTNVEITAENAESIYYTLDGSEPTKSSTLYTEAIVLSEDGELELKAVAYGQSGYASKVTTNTYNIEISVLPAPVVTPAAGEYTESTMIEVEVPEGYTAYYTYSTGGSAPTTSSNKYNEPIEMLVGNNIFSVIVVSPTGKVSEVTSMIYKLYTVSP